MTPIAWIITGFLIALALQVPFLLWRRQARLSRVQKPAEQASPRRRQARLPRVHQPAVQAAPIDRQARPSHVHTPVMQASPTAMAHPLSSSTFVVSQSQRLVIGIGLGVITILLLTGQFILTGPLWWQADLSWLTPFNAIPCVINPVCRFAFPNYFGPALFFLAAGGALAVWVTYLTDQSSNSWVEDDSSTVGDTGWYLLGLCLTVLALAGWGSYNWPLALGLTLAAFAALWFSWKRGWQTESLFGGPLDRLMLLAFAVFALLASAYGLRLWRWAAYGDDYSFYWQATRIIAGEETWIPWTSGIDGFYAIGHSLAAVATMLVYGMDAYGWRICSSIALAFSVPGLWLVVRLFWHRNIALLSAGFFAGSYMLMSYSKIGYNHALVFIPFIWSMALVGWGIRRKNFWLLGLGGAFGGLGFYTLALARLAILPCLGLLILYRPLPLTRRQYLQMWAVVLGAFALIAAPVLLNFETWGVLWQQASLGTRMAQERAGRNEPDISTADYIFRNILYGFGSWLWSSTSSHEVYGSYLDPLSSLMAALGLVLLLAGQGVATVRARLWLMASYLGAVLAAAGANPYPAPSANRMFALIPFYAIWAALGANQYGYWLAAVFGKPIARLIFSSVLLVVVGGLGIYQMIVLTPAHDQLMLQVDLALRIVQEEPSAGKVCFLARDHYNVDIPNSFYSAFHLSPSQWLVTNQVPPPIDDASCKVILLDALLPDLPDLDRQMHEKWPNLVKSEGYDESGALFFIRYDISP